MSDEVKKLRAMLEELEWCAVGEGDMGETPPRCPICEVYPEFYWDPQWDENPAKRKLRARNQHKPDCRLAAMLRQGEDK